MSETQITRTEQREPNQENYKFQRIRQTHDKWASKIITGTILSTLAAIVAAVYFGITTPKIGYVNPNNPQDRVYRSDDTSKESLLGLTSAGLILGFPLLGQGAYRINERARKRRNKKAFEE